MRISIQSLDKKSSQPTKAVWEQLPSEYKTDGKGNFLGGTKAGNGAWAIACVDTVMQLPAEEPDNAMIMTREANSILLSTESF